MPRLVFVDKCENRDIYPDDVERIVGACKQCGFDISEDSAQRSWLAHNESMCAGWLSVPDRSEDIFKIVKRFCSVFGGTSNDPE